MSDRKTFEEIYQTIDSDNHLTFDYLCFIVVAACISAAGLLFDRYLRLSHFPRDGCLYDVMLVALCPVLSSWSLRCWCPR